MNVIVYSTGAVGCAVVTLVPPGAPPPTLIDGIFVQGDAPAIDYEAEAAKIVPSGATHIVADKAALPTADPATWKIVNGAIQIDAAATAAGLRAYAAQKRFSVETGGIAVGGVTIRTDRESQATVNGAYAATLMDPNFSTTWKNADGSWSELSAAQIVAVASAVKDHVAASFAAEKAADDAIDAGTITSFAQIDAAAWPANG